ncbi:response regulator transcription factor [Mollicutes bacterium LVI A0078]|nr:response regulator transcription factor [Mollicutes bacterium LVI A0075]WOO90429.1 response regulator transcription factor [Mollicutes bacterium LVI A0078]
MKILIIEDEPIINDYMRALLQDDYQVVSSFDASGAIKIIEEGDVELILCDIILGHESGFSVLEYIQNHGFKIPTVMLTALDDEQSLTTAYDLGAVDYIVKPVNKQILKMKVRNLQTYLKPKDNELEIDTNLFVVKINGVDINLTNIEYEIFALLSSAPDRVFTKDNLIDTIWHGNHSMSNRIVDTNIFNLRKKLGHKSELIKTKRGVGYYYENKK